MKRKPPKMSIEEKKDIARQFAQQHATIKNIKQVQYDSKRDCFVVMGENYFEKSGQGRIFSTPWTLYVWVSNWGTATFTKPPTEPWGENANDI